MRDASAGMRYASPELTMSADSQTDGETFIAPPDNFIDFLALDLNISRELAEQKLIGWVGEYPIRRRESECINGSADSIGAE